MAHSLGVLEESMKKIKYKLKELNEEQTDKICVKANHICVNCKLYMYNATYQMYECAIDHNTWRVRDEYREKEIDI